MDGIDEPPRMKRFTTNRLNTFLDALYIVPRRIGKLSLRMRPPRPRKEEIYFIGACNVPLELARPGAHAPGPHGPPHLLPHAHVGGPARHLRPLHGQGRPRPGARQPEKRDELARITNGYSPAMIDQVCSMALTYAHSDGRQGFEWTDIVEAMTTVESGVAIDQPYPKHEERATAIHEAGHAVCSHLYGENRLSTRLSIRKRGASGGHHQAMEIEDRFSDWRSEEVADLIWGLGAMAAEYVFYGQNTTGVGGDVHSATCDAARMVGRHAMGPARIDLSDRIEDREERADEEKRITERTPGARLPDHAPLRRRLDLEDDGMSRVARGPAQAPADRRAARPGVRRRLQHRAPEPRRHRPRRRRADAARASSTATRSSTCSSPRTCASPRSTCSTRRHGQRSDPASLPRRPARR